MVNFATISQHPTPDESPGFLLWKASTSWRRALERVLKPFALTHPQFVILATTAWLTKEQEIVTQAAIGAYASIDPNTTSQIMKGLETKGLISRKRKTRSQTPRLTKEGETLLSQTLPLIEKEDTRFFAAVNLKTALPLLHTLASVADIEP